MVPKLGSQRFTALALLSATSAVLLHALLTGAKLVGLPPVAYVIGLVMALLATVLPAFLLARGIALIGSGPAAIISTVGPVSTILLAYLVLQESHLPDGIPGYGAGHRRSDAGCLERQTRQT